MPRTILMLWVLAAGAVAAEAQIPHERGLLVGTWQLDSLGVVPIGSELSDSARASLDRYTRVLANANDKFPAGECASSPSTYVMVVSSTPSSKGRQRLPFTGN